MTSGKGPTQITPVFHPLDLALSKASMDLRVTSETYP